MTSLARNRFPSGLGWFVLLALLLLAWCHGLSSCGTRQKAIVRSYLDSAWSKQALELSRERARVWYLLEDMRLEQLRTWSGEIVDYDTAGRTRRRATFSGSEEGKAEGSRNTSSSDTLSEKAATGQDQGQVKRGEGSKNVDADTTWQANFPSWLILTVAAMIIGAVFLYFKLRP